MSHHLPELGCSVPEHRRNADKQLLAEVVSAQSAVSKVPRRLVPHTVRGVIVTGLVTCIIFGGTTAATRTSPAPEPDGAEPSAVLHEGEQRLLGLVPQGHDRDP